MFERFTERARQVIVLARDEARELRHDYIGTEHLLLGLLREEEGMAARALTSLDITFEQVRAGVVGAVGLGGAVFSGEVPFTPRAKKVLELSLREAISLDHNYIGTEHILLGLAHEHDGVAASVLLALGVTDGRLREAVTVILSDGPQGRPAGGIAVPNERTRSLTVGSLLDSIRDRTLGDVIDTLTTAREAAVEARDLDRMFRLQKVERLVIDLAASIAYLTGPGRGFP